MKKKLSLRVDTLRVESFDTDAGAAARGTVHAWDGAACVTFSCEGTCGAPPPSDGTAWKAVPKPTRQDVTGCLPCCV
ncbi:MAG TPA: hypothetical protein VFQ39_05595 [Longimicrobium sp.]|nr:hypothetical protein [Longimicrobium sp.]